MGDGAFTLKHSFEDYPSLAQGSTDNLMDYNTGSVLWKKQWDKIHDPATVLGLFEEDQSGAYETDGHYSTVYLISLLLGMDKDLAQKLASATEAPDTYVHSEYQFEVNDTWFYPVEQTQTHSLTYGYHGVEEFFTAMGFLNTEKSKISELGKLLHRYGDTYAHTRLDNLTPEQWSAIDEYEPVNWFIDVWMAEINAGLKEYGISFLKDEDMQKRKLRGQTLENYLSENLIVSKTDYFRMYGKSWIIPGMTIEHIDPDGKMPDYIYVRPKWYLRYVNNMAILIATKFSLDIKRFNDLIFHRMTSFAETHKCNLKGILDYEISKQLGKNYFFVPVYYSRQVIASLDAVFYTDYVKLANEIKNNAISYIVKNYGVVEKNIIVEEIKRPWYNPIIINKKGISYLYSYKITVK